MELRLYKSYRSNEMPMPSQRDIAEDIKVSLSSYQRYENYEVVMPSDVLFRFANRFDIKDLREIKVTID